MRSPGKMLLRLLGSILGIGAVGCGGHHGGALYGPMPLYGVPAAEYKLSGTVVDSGTDAAIPGTSLSFKDQTTTSAADGTWSIDVRGYPCGNTCSLSAKDTDGTDNGSYTDQDVTLAPTRVSPGSGGFDDGVFEQKNIKVSLVPKL